MIRDIYLDGNATSAVLPEAVAAAAHAMSDLYGNPSSTHATGLQAKAMLDAVRTRARRLLGVGDGRLMFNSGATEGIQTAMLSALFALRERRERGEAIGTCLVYGATEHKAVPESLAHWNRLLGLNLPLAVLRVDTNGQHDLQQLRALAPDAALICTMAANNETGVISDLAGIEAVLDETGSAAYWLVDCVQALGKLALKLAATRIDYAPFSGHKLYAPKGIGMLYVRAGAPFTAMFMGGGQEAGLRSGTENMSGIAALGAVLQGLEDGSLFRSHAELCDFRERLAASLRSALPGVVFNMPFDLSLPTTLNFSVPGLASRELLDVFDAGGVRVSSGSACSSNKSAPSYVLEAMDVPAWRSIAAIRLSFGPATDEATIDAACQRIADCGAALRSGGLLPSASDVAPQDGVHQFSADGACCWMVVDAASRSCIVIDPFAAVAPRVQAHVRQYGLHLRAVLATSGEVDAALMPVAQAPAFDMAVPLANGTVAQALSFGTSCLVSVPLSAGHTAYLLGDAPEPGAQFTAQYAWPGNASLDSALLTPATLLCHSSDSSGAFFRMASGTQTGQVIPVLDGAALDSFLQTHPDAMLIDVREAYEHAACTAAPNGSARRATHSIPLSQLPGHIHRLLAANAPLMFICRSGARSQRAAACLQGAGHRHVYSLEGGMALSKQYF